MKFDTIIIGGGLSGLINGINQSKKGKKCAIISTGQSAIHFFSGSLDLMGYEGEEECISPLEAIAKLPATHPYSKMGISNVKEYVKKVIPFFNEVGIKFNGSAEKNSYRITPLGIMKPTWLTLDEFTSFENKDSFPFKKATILNLAGFLDFPTEFIAEGLSKSGISCKQAIISLSELQNIRHNPTEMRSSNIAKEFDKAKVLDELIDNVNRFGADDECIIFPDVFGLYSTEAVKIFKAKVKKPLYLLPAIPPSVPGIRIQMMLKDYFIKLGGMYFLGDEVTEGIFEDNKLTAVKTVNHQDITMRADNFVLATGSFFSKGLISNQNKVIEPIFNLDVDADSDRKNWCDEQFFNDQAFMHYGVSIDADFHATLGGKSIENLYVAGSSISGANSLKEASGAGVTILTSLFVADKIK